MCSLRVEPGALLAQPPMGRWGGVEWRWSEGEQEGEGRGQGTRWAMHSSNTDESRSTAPGPGHHLHRQGASSFPVLSCARPLKKQNLLSFQKWHEAIQSPGLPSLLCLPSPMTIYFLFHRSGCPSGSDTTLLLQVLARSGLICSGKNSGRIKCPCGNSSWIVYIFYHFILTSQPSPLPGSPPAMQPFINLKHGHPLLESVQLHRRNQFFAFHFSFKARKNLLIWIQRIVTLESKGMQLLGGNTQLSVTGQKLPHAR